MNTYSCRIKNAAGEHAQKFVPNARYHPFYFSFAFINQTPIQCISISSNHFLFYFFRLANQTPISPYQALLFFFLRLANQTPISPYQALIFYFIYFFYDWLLKHLYLNIKHSLFILFFLQLANPTPVSPYEALSFFFLRLANTYISISSTHFFFFCDWLIKHLYLHIKHSFFIFIYFLQLAKQTPISP